MVGLFAEADYWIILFYYYEIFLYLKIYNFYCYFIRESFFPASFYIFLEVLLKILSDNL